MDLWEGPSCYWLLRGGELNCAWWDQTGDGVRGGRAQSFEVGVGHRCWLWHGCQCDYGVLIATSHKRVCFVLVAINFVVIMALFNWLLLSQLLLLTCSIQFCRASHNSMKGLLTPLLFFFSVFSRDSHLQSVYGRRWRVFFNIRSYTDVLYTGQYNNSW